MKKNVGSLDRVARALGAFGMGLGALWAPLDLTVRLGLGITAGYVLFTAAVGTCLGYRLMGRSTCPLESR